MEFSSAVASAVSSRCLLTALVLVLLGCGGGNENTDAANNAAPASFNNNGGMAGQDQALIFMEIEESTTGSGLDINFSDAYLPLGPVASVWNFSVFNSLNWPVGTYSILVNSIDGIASLFKIMSRAGPYSQTFQFEDAAAASAQTYYLREDGVYRFVNVQLRNMVLQWKPRLYPFRSPAQGIERRGIGVLPPGKDLNGDGAPDSASFEFKQTLVAYDDLPGLPVHTAHFKNVFGYTVTLTSNGQPGAPEGERVEEDVWLAPGLGPVRVQRGGLKHQLTSAQVGDMRFP
jgi:hypothetical protein